MGKTLCPVCGTARNDPGSAACSKCGCSFAFARYFSSQSAKEYREHHINLLKKHSAEPIRGLIMLDRGIAFIQGGKLIRCEPEGICTMPGVDAVQIARSRTHELLLTADGRVKSFGDGRFGQTCVDDLTGIRFVLAGPNCSYCVDANGRVLIRGLCPSNEVVEAWKDIVSLAAGNHHLAALNARGEVFIACGLQAPKELQRCSYWKDIKEIAAAGNFVVGLDEHGHVHLAGDAFEDCLCWEGIEAIAAAGNCIVGLQKGGRVFVDGGKRFSTAGEWENIAHIAASGNGVAAIDTAGRLHIVGLPDTDQRCMQRLWKTLKSPVRP